MQGYIHREITENINRKLRNIPVVAILGPRQCGKSTLAKEIIKGTHNTLYLDLERPSDLSKLQDPEAFFRINAHKLICLDEVQRSPELFTVLRSVIDENKRNGQFLVLGSASPLLIRQSSETLAGRISYFELTPFLYKEVVEESASDVLWDLWQKGGFPRSYLNPDQKESLEWRIDFIRTFLERDIPNLGFRTPAKSIERFWQMCAHLHGQILNRSKLGESLGVTHHTVNSYIDLLSQTFILRILPPYEANLKKRLVKSPKIYIRDTGLLHALLGVETQNDLLGHPVYGASWEGFVIENILASLPNWRASFYRSSAGSEIDLILEKGKKRIGIECKTTASLGLSKGFWNAVNDLELNEVRIVTPVSEGYPINKNVFVSPLVEVIEYLLKIS